MDLYGGRPQDGIKWRGVHRMDLCEGACIGGIYMEGCGVMFICMGAYFTGQK